MHNRVELVFINDKLVKKRKEKHVRASRFCVKIIFCHSDIIGHDRVLIHFLRVTRSNANSVVIPKPATGSNHSLIDHLNREFPHSAKFRLGKKNITNELKYKLKALIYSRIEDE